jgi:hypothetical protein
MEPKTKPIFVSIKDPIKPGKSIYQKVDNDTRTKLIELVK